MMTHSNNIDYSGVQDYKCLRPRIVFNILSNFVSDLADMYKRIITYNFDNDDTRDSFVDLITGLGFEVQPDQSTYAQCK